MDSFKNYSGNRTVHIFITFIAVFLFFIILGFTATASADDVKKDAASGLKGNTVNEWDIIAEVNGKTITTSEILNQYNILHSLYYYNSRDSGFDLMQKQYQL